MCLERDTKSVQKRVEEAENIQHVLENKKKVLLTDCTPGILNKNGFYYLVLLQIEVDKIHHEIHLAEQYAVIEIVPESALGDIRNAIGKAKLLLQRRLKQFSDLCELNITGELSKEGKVTTPSDLEGFWSMVTIQVEDVMSLFENIRVLRNNQWVVVETVTRTTFYPSTAEVR